MGLVYGWKVLIDVDNNSDVKCNGGFTTGCSMSSDQFTSLLKRKINILVLVWFSSKGKISTSLCLLALQKWFKLFYLSQVW